MTDDKLKEEAPTVESGQGDIDQRWGEDAESYIGLDDPNRKTFMIRIDAQPKRGVRHD